ncbi:MAG: phosphoribosylamine--glycine ligase [Candidatus Bathyarchaeota archaeon]|nr:phosphoribosylamine--glycine ligase [Candidatus Bathyarchaeota archaeon]
MAAKEALNRILLVGGGAREHAIGEALCRSQNVELFVVANNRNPGLEKLSSGNFVKRNEKDKDFIKDWALTQKINLAVIGLEDPLEVGLPDELNSIKIPTVGPISLAAQLETSKIFTRNLMRDYNIQGQVEYHYFTDANSFRKFLLSSSQDFALKPIGLTAGKGVKIMGEHFKSKGEAIDYGETVLHNTGGLIVEERLFGEEFTLQTFVDGETVLPMPLVQDFKRALEGDVGPNTGSMGSYSQSDGLLPFVTKEERDQALEIIRQVIHALRDKKILYQGILYGQFMITEKGLKLIEINARFGDPEAINVLPLLENDFVNVCRAITKGTLKSIDIHFLRKATVCKYITPPKYGYEPVQGEPIKLDTAKIESLGVRVYYAKLEKKGDLLLTTTSRSIALLGIGDSVEQAEALVEHALSQVQGNDHVRHDIATKELLQRKARGRKIPISA